MWGWGRGRGRVKEPLVSLSVNHRSLHLRRTVQAGSKPGLSRNRGQEVLSCSGSWGRSVSETGESSMCKGWGVHLGMDRDSLGSL